MHISIVDKINIAGSRLQLIELGENLSIDFLAAEEQKQDKNSGKTREEGDGKVMTDNWRAYAEYPPDEAHTESKAEIYTFEGYNSILGIFW